MAKPVSPPVSPPPLTPFKIAIPPEKAGQRLDKALTDLLQMQVPALSRARLQALMAASHVFFEGKPVTDASRKVKDGEQYLLNMPPLEAALPEAQDIKLKILFEDKDILVIDKPAGMVVHPAPGNRDRTLVNALLAHCGKSLSGIGGIARPGIVHRLDKDTSGLIVVAKNDVAHQSLTQQFADRSLSRTYQALVWGVPDIVEGEIEAPIGRHPRDRKKMAVVSRGKGKAALTYFKLLEEFGDVSLLECKLATGRTHQIRVHMAHVKLPVIGDPVYGARKVRKMSEHAKLLEKFPRQALHAARLKLKHPRTGKNMSFASPLPKDMKSLLAALRRM